MDRIDIKIFNKEISIKEYCYLFFIIDILVSNKNKRVRDGEMTYSRMIRYI